MNAKSIPRVRLLLLIGLLLLLLLPIIGPYCIRPRKEIKARELLQKCREIRIGMTRQQVIEIMGEPARTMTLKDLRDGRKKEILFFDSPAFASESTQCTIDVQSGLVEEVHCGESYYRIEKKDHGKLG